MLSGELKLIRNRNINITPPVVGLIDDGEMRGELGAIALILVNNC